MLGLYEPSREDEAVTNGATGTHGVLREDVDGSCRSLHYAKRWGRLAPVEMTASLLGTPVERTDCGWVRLRGGRSGVAIGV